VLKGHYWTLMPRLGRALRRSAAPPGIAWSTVLLDPTTGDVRLSGRLHVPLGAREAVVLVHGLGGSTESDYLRAAAAAAESAGIASLRLSLRGADRRGED
jgi:predicted alpha/beta-fold hydrolase